MYRKFSDVYHVVLQCSDNDGDYMEDLKLKCPLCYSNNVGVQCFNDTQYRVVCCDCNVTSGIYPRRQSAITAWENYVRCINEKRSKIDMYDNIADAMERDPDKMIENRTARCAYWTSGCTSTAPSGYDLPFFHEHNDEPYDSYYCGCYGWD